MLVSPRALFEVRSLLLSAALATLQAISNCPAPVHSPQEGCAAIADGCTTMSGGFRESKLKWLGLHGKHFIHRTTSYPTTMALLFA